MSSSACGRLLHRLASILFEPGDGQVYEMAQLGIFLSSCKVLEKVSLRFANWNSATPYPLHRGAATVQDVEFTFHNCTPAAGMAMCKSFQFPEASKLSVSLWSFDEEESENQESREKQEALIREFLLRHPLTRTFSLEYHPGELRFVPIELPILLFPALQKLVLSFESWTELTFCDSSSNSADFRLPPIRILELHMFNMEAEWEHLRIWAEMFFVQLKKQGDLCAFELFAIFEREGRSNPSMLEGAIHDYLPLEKFHLCPER